MLHLRRATCGAAAQPYPDGVLFRQRLAEDPGRAGPGLPRLGSNFLGHVCLWRFQGCDTVRRADGDEWTGLGCSDPRLPESGARRWSRPDAGADTVAHLASQVAAAGHPRDRYMSIEILSLLMLAITM